MSIFLILALLVVGGLIGFMIGIAAGFESAKSFYEDKPTK